MDEDGGGHDCLCIRIKVLIRGFWNSSNALGEGSMI